MDQSSRATFSASPERPSRINVSPREREVLLHISEGLTDQEIANKLFVSIWTIRVHASHLRRKFNVTNRTALAKAAREAGFI